MTNPIDQAIEDLEWIVRELHDNAPRDRFGVGADIINKRRKTILTALQSLKERDAVDVEGLKKATIYYDGQDPITDEFGTDVIIETERDKGWNECLDHLANGYTIVRRTQTDLQREDGS